MDALDLTTGERIPGVKFLPKGSRRKAATPQRRQHGEGDSSENSDKNSECDKIESASFDGEDNREESGASLTPPRPSSASSKPEESDRNLTESKDILSPDVPNLSTMIGDLAKKYLQGRDKLAAMTVARTMLDRSRHYLPNTNYNYRPSPPHSSDTPPQESESVSSDYRNSPVQKELPLSLWNPARGFAMDELMQQRLRRYLDDVQPAEAPGIPERTKKQNRWAFNVWREWARKRNALEDSFIGPYKGVPLDVGQAGEEELDYWLCKFVMEIRRKDGNPYPPHTLMQIVMGIQRYLRQQAGKPTICILDRSNATYSNFRSVLDYRIKELTSLGSPSLKSISRTPAFGDSRSKYENTRKGDSHPFLSDRTESCSDWKDGVMNSDTAQGLLNAVFWHNYSTFGIQYIDDHWNLRAEHFQIHGKNESSDPMTLEFTPSTTSVIGATGKQNSMRVAQKTIYSDTDKEIFNIYRKYLSNIPKSGPFYRHPVDPTIVDRSIKFSDQWVGKNRLRAMLKHLIDIGRNAARLKSLKSVARATDLPARNFVTPMVQLSGPEFPSATAIQENMELIKPFLNLHQVKSVSKREADRDSNGDDELSAPSPKMSKSIPAEPKDPLDPGRNSPLDDGVLEINVPNTIKSITVIKAGKKISFHLE